MADDEDGKMDQLLRAVVFLGILAVNVIVWGVLIVICVKILEH